MRILRFLLALALTTVAGLAIAGPAAAFPTGQAGSGAIDTHVFAPGDPAVVTVEHTTPGALTLRILSDSSRATIGAGTVAADGTGSVSGVVPTGFPDHQTIEVIGAGGENYRFSIWVTATRPGISEQVNGGCSGTGDGPLYGVAVVTISSTYPTARTFRLTLAPGGLERRLTVPAGGQAQTSFNPLVDGTYTVRTFGVGLGAGTVTSVDSRCGTATLPTPPAPTSPPAPTTPTPDTSATTDAPTLANTGTRAGADLGVGLVALLVGGLVLVLSRRRPGRRAR